MIGVAAATATATHAGNGTLVAAAAIGVAAIILLITLAKMHAFIALILGSAVAGLIAGLGGSGTLSAFTDSFGGTVGDIGILIALGAMLGKLLADSGGADRIVDSIVGRVSVRLLPWALALVSFLIGLPLFFEVGVVLVLPIVLLAAKRTGSSYVVLSLSALASLSLLNGFVVPHPGPLIAVSGFNADLGLTLLLGVVVAIPTIVLGGPLLAKVLARYVTATPPADLIPASTGVGVAGRRPPFGSTLVTMLLPVFLMLCNAIAELILPEGSPVLAVTGVFGEPAVALLLGLLLGVFTLGFGSGMDLAQIGKTMGKGLPAIAGVVLIVGAGGGFKGVLVASGVGDAIASIVQTLGIPLLLFAWLLTALIRIAVGSGTVAIVTAVGLLAPMASSLSPVEASLLVLAVGAGSRFMSHVNDAGFWLVKEYLGLDVKDTFKTWTIMDCTISLVALGGVSLINLFV